MATSNSLTKEILKDLRNGNIKKSLMYKPQLSSFLSYFYNKNELNENDLDLLLDILTIGNIVYNNADLDDEKQLIDNEIYDKLVVIYSRYRTPPVGGEPISFNNVADDNEELIDMVVKVPHVDSSDIFYKEIVYEDINPYKYYDGKTPMIYRIPSGRGRNTAHDYPELVGSISKVKCVLDSQAVAKGLYEEPNYPIMERDFFRLHFEKGIINGGQEFGSVISMKYDGVSVEAEVKTIDNHGTPEVIVNTARTRGDADNDLGRDISHILYGYKFYNAPPNLFDDPMGVKFEAVMTYANLSEYNAAKGKKYVNPRSAISSIINNDDGALYQRFITLVPIQTSIDWNSGNNRKREPRELDVEFLKYLCNEEPFRYISVYGDFNKTIFMVDKFVKDVLKLRSALPIMIDGVVFEYADEDIRRTLGRKGSINQFSVAIKFDPMEKNTVFRGYNFTIGADGRITPIVYFDPIDFNGNIYDHSSLYSYARFKELELRLGDIVTVKYTNEVMPYVSKAECKENEMNTNPIFPFITSCPSCGTKLAISQSGKTYICPNTNCRSSKIKRLSNMISKLGVRDFSDKSIEKLNFNSFKDMINATPDKLSVLKEVNSDKFLQRMNELKTNPIYDYVLIGSLGFTGISVDTWKLILDKYTIQDILRIYTQNPVKMSEELSQIKGIGKVTCQTIIEQIPSFIEDIEFISNMPNVIHDSNDIVRKKIRISGFRDRDFIQSLIDEGYDVSDKSVTKDTSLLIVDNIGNTGSKVKTAERYGIPIVSLSQFINDRKKYLSIV